MVKNDSYNSISKRSEGIFKDKGSKFLAFAFTISSEEEAKKHLETIKKKYHDARHHCYAYKIGLGDDRYRVNDDGEPSGTAGKPIYGQILSRELSDILIVVVRYFGGVLLGTGGLINAYKNAAANAIDNAQFTTKVVKSMLKVGFNYELMSPVMRIVKDHDLEVVKQDFTETCKLTLNIRLDDFEKIKEKYSNLYGVEILK